jgi:hypothetical protein
MTSCRVLALTVLGLVTLAGCGDPPPEPTTTPSSAATPAAGPKSAQLSSKMVSAVSASKNSTAISVHFSLESTPSVSQPLPVEIVIVPHQEFETVRAHFESQEGLSLPTGADFGPASDVDPEKPLSHQLVLLPGKEGMFMVTVSVDTVGSEGNIVRIFSIPVIVGSAQPASAPAPAPSEAPKPQPAP